MKNYTLITGGAGYIGSKFAYDAIDCGLNVIIVDDLSTGNKKLVPKKSIFIKSDISNKKKIKKIFNSYKITQVVHFAASISVSESMKFPLKYYKNNTIATEAFIKICCEHKIKKFIFSSTAAVYGNSKKTIISENNNCFPNSHYGKSKLLAEMILKNYSIRYGFGLGILRYFNVIGADKNMRTGCINNIGQLFKNLSEAIYKKEYKINILGNNYPTKDGTGLRDYIDINDLSLCHLKLLTRLNLKKIITLNCGYNKGYSVLEIIKKFEKISKKKFIILISKRREGDIAKIICNNYKLIRFLNLKLKTNLQQSIKNSISWERKWNKIREI